MLQTLEKHGAPIDLIHAFRQAVDRVEITFPNLEEPLKAQMAQLRAQKIVAEQRFDVLAKSTLEIHEKFNALIQDVE